MRGSGGATSTGRRARDREWSIRGPDARLEGGHGVCATWERLPWCCPLGRVAAREEVARLEALPGRRPSCGSPDPTPLLVMAEGHEQALGVIASVDDSFWRLQRIAGVVRGRELTVRGRYLALSC